ncbi:hypothetical protein CRUP_029018 [Coryphaenoides rupestris]|nr:hypothetical protein CRUP_029018 [Coryphaenoides rupestris]
MNTTSAFTALVAAALLLLLCVSTTAAVAAAAAAEPKTKNCNEVRAAYSSKGFNVNDVPHKGVPGDAAWRRPSWLRVSSAEKKKRSNTQRKIKCSPKEPPKAANHLTGQLEGGSRSKKKKKKKKRGLQRGM